MKVQDYKCKSSRYEICLIKHDYILDGLVLNKHKYINTLNLFKLKTSDYFILYILMILIYLRGFKCQAYENNAYPIIHGAYYSSINDSFALEEYSYCHAENLELFDMNLFSNDDILLTYNLITINDPNDKSLQSKVTALVRVDCITGKTLWAKKLYYNVDLMYFVIVKTFIINDTVWTLLSSLQPNIYSPALIASTSSKGIVNEVFSVSGQYSSISASYFLAFEDFYMFSDFSFITIAKCSYNQGDFGVSVLSKFDFCFFKYNKNKEFQWSTSIDYLNGIEERESMLEFNNTAYITITTSIYYYCLLNLNITSGSVLKSQCAYVYTPINNGTYRNLDILLVTDDYVYAGGDLTLYDELSIYYGVYLFNASSLKLVKIYQHSFCSYSFAFRNSKLMRDEIYCYYPRDLFIFSYYTQEINQSSNNMTDFASVLSFSVKFLGDLYLPFIIRRTSSGSFVYALLRNFIDPPQNPNYTEVFIFKFDDDYNTHSCVFFDSFHAAPYYEYVTIVNNYTQNRIYQDESVTPAVISHNTSYICNNTILISNYTFYDITECIWPRYLTNTCSCVAQFPIPLLNNKYEFNIGSNIDDVHSIPAYYQSQNAKFVITAKDYATDLVVDWIVINQANSSISIFTSQVKSVHEYIICFNAKLITFALDQYNSNKTITDNYYVSFNFTNRNCVILSTNATYYVVINQLSIFSLNFYDQENDNILLILKNYDQIGLYWRQDSISSHKLILFLQANTYSEDPIQIIVTYTDSYHQDASFYQNFSISVYSFQVDPPSFENNLETFHADRCSNYKIMLPNISDPNTLDCSVSINQPYPNWVQLSNNTLYLNTADQNLYINETTIVTLKITNSKKAWREYNQTIITDLYFRPSFAFIQNISVSDNNLHEINIDVVSSFEVDAIDCMGNLSIGWIRFKDNYSKMYIYYPFQIENEKCVELRSYDSCKIAVFSNKFYILSNAKYPLPPSICNTFGPIKVYVGNNSLFLIPSDLFCTQNNSKLEYSASVVNCSNHSPLIISISEAIFGGNYLFILSNEEKSCLITIKAVDLYYQSSEILVSVDVISCASKDCISCENEYQSGCTKCKLNYILDESGSCILNKSFYPSSINSIIDMCGIITLTCLLAQLLMSIRLGFNTLQSIEFSQAILIIFTSFYQNDIDLNQYASWIQFFKLDFGFLDFLKLRNLNIVHCKQDSNRMGRIQLYCESSLLNYFYLIAIIIMFIICMQILKCLQYKFSCCSKIYQFTLSRLNKTNFAYIFIHFISLFFVISMINDIASINNHMILSILLLLLIISVLIILFYNYPEVLSLPFLSQVDTQNTSILTYLTFAKLALQATLFFVTDGSISTIIFILLMLVYALAVLYFIFASKGNSLLQNYNRKMNGIKYR